MSRRTSVVVSIVMLLATIGISTQVLAQTPFEVIRKLGNSTPQGPLNPNDLVEGLDGALYGTSQRGGTAGFGTVYKTTTAGAITVLYNFTGTTDGAAPTSALIQARDGNFYGTTMGGPSLGGTIFMITPAGSFATLHVFGGSDGAGPYGTLVENTDGNLYGTTMTGGAAGLGTAFRLTPSGTFAVLHSFAGGTDGAIPTAGLLLARDGNFYGSTAGGGAVNLGTVFTMTPGGTVSVLHEFTGGGIDGATPLGILAQASDDVLYGSTYAGGSANGGTVFSITTAGVYKKVTDLTGAVGGTNPTAGPTMVANTVGGVDLPFTTNLLLTTRFGPSGSGSPGAGSVISVIYKLGLTSNMHTFDGPGGANPVGRLIYVRDRGFYGTTAGGGDGFGVIFRLPPPPPPPPPTCAVTMNASYASGTLHVNGTIETAKPGRWTATIDIHNVKTQLWSIDVPRIVPAAPYATSIQIPLTGLSILSTNVSPADTICIAFAFAYDEWPYPFPPPF